MGESGAFCQTLVAPMALREHLFARLERRVHKSLVEIRSQEAKQPSQKHMAQKRLAALKRAAEALARLAFFEKLTGTWRLCEYLSATVGCELTLHNVHEHAAVLHMRLLRRQIMLRGDRMCAAAVQIMLFFTRKVLGTMASALSRWSSCVQQRKAKAFRTAMARGLRCHCLLASAFSAWQSCEREDKQLVIKWRANTLVESTEDLIPAEPSTRADRGQFQVIMHEEGCADVDDQDGRQLATPIEGNLRLALVPAAEAPLLRPSNMEHRYRGIPVASAALRRAVERSSRALPPSTAAAAPLQPPWSPAGVHRASLTEALQTLKARVAQRKHCQQQERTSTRASTQAPLSAGRGRKPVIQPNVDCLNALIVSPISHSSESGQTGKGASVTADTSQTSGCGDAECALLDTGASEPPAKQLCHNAPAQRALESAADAAVQPRQAHVAAIGVTGQSEPCMVMAADQDAGHLSGALGRPGSGQLHPAPPNGAKPTAVVTNRRTGGQCSESEKHAGCIASKERHDTSDKQSAWPDGRMQEGRRKLARQGRLAALQRIEAQRSLRTRSDAESDGPDSEERAASRLYEEHLLRQALEAFQAWGIRSRSERRALLSIVFTSWRCLVACSKADEEVKRAKEQEAVSRAFYQWQLQSLRSRLESVTKALAARNSASPAVADFFALHHHSQVAAVVTVQPPGQAPPPLDIAALHTVWSRHTGVLTAAMADIQAADVRKAGSEEAGRAALHTSLATEDLRDGPGADVEDASAEEEPACSMASSWHTKVTEQASPEALTGTEAAEMQDASSAAQMASGEALPMDVTTVCRSIDRQDTCGEDSGSQAYQAQEPWNPSDEAIQQEASEQIGEAGTRSGSALCTEDAVESAGSCGYTPHPDDDGLHDWLRCSCIGSAEAGLCDEQVNITGMQQSKSQEPGMQRAGAIDKVPAKVEHSTGDGPEAAPQLDLGSALSRNGLVPFPDSASTAGQMACADGLDSPGSPGKGKAQMSAQDMVFDTPPASSVSGPAVGLSSISSIATSMHVGATAPSACSVEPAGSAGKPTVASSARVQRVHSKEEEDMASRATDNKQISKSPCAAENERMHAVGGQQCQSTAPTAAAQALMGSPGLPTGQIAPLVCAVLGSGGVRLPAICSEALASPVTLAKRPPAGCGRFALGQPPALPEGAPPDGHRGPGTPSTAPQCHGGSSGRLSQDDSSFGDSSGQQDSCMGSSAGEDGSREQLRKRLFHSVDCCQPAVGGPTEGMPAPADTCQQIEWSKGAVGPLQQGCMGGGSSVGSTAPQLTPAPLEAGCRGSSRVQSLRASFEAAASCNTARNLLGAASGQRSHSFAGSRALPRCHPFDGVSTPQRFSSFRQWPRTEESAGSNDMFRWQC